MARGLVVGGKESETADSGKNLGNRAILGRVVSSVPEGNLRILCKSRERRQFAVGLECSADVARIEKNSIDDENIQVLIAGQLYNVGIVGLTV